MNLSSMGLHFRGKILSSLQLSYLTTGEEESSPLTTRRSSSRRPTVLSRTTESVDNGYTSVVGMVIPHHTTFVGGRFNMNLETTVYGQNTGTGFIEIRTKK